MRYDLSLVHDLCCKVGLPTRITTGHCVEVDLGAGATLYFENAEHEDDCSIGFFDTPWHTHGDLMFADGGGNCVELDYLELIVGLKEGRVLICERQVDGRVTDRWLIHHKFNDEFEYMEEGERILVRRAAMPPAERSRT